MPKFCFTMASLTTIAGVAQYKIQIDEADLANTTDCVRNIADSNCLVFNKVFQKKNNLIELYFKIDAETYTEIIIQFFLITAVLISWGLLINSSLNRDAVSSVLLGYMGAAADITEFFFNINNTSVKKNSSLVRAIIGL